MQTIIDLFTQTSMTFDDVEYLCGKYNLRYSFADALMTVTDGENEVKFTVVVEDVVIHIFDYDY